MSKQFEHQVQTACRQTLQTPALKLHELIWMDIEYGLHAERLTFCGWFTLEALLYKPLIFSICSDRPINPLQPSSMSEWFEHRV